jgi:hypothetical protein
MRSLALLLLPVVALLGCATTHGMSPEAAHAAFTKLVDDFFAAEFAFDPVEATKAGIHQYDSELEAWPEPRIQARVAELEQLLNRATALWTERTALDANDLIDL